MEFGGKITDAKLDSRFLQEEIAMKIYLPENYSPLYTYQLLIVQDGDDYWQKGKLTTLAKQLLSQKEINDLIIVMIPYQNIEDRSQKYHPNGSKNSQYIRFLAEELIPYLEARFHTFEVPSSRTLLGDSLAGTVSLHAAFQYPYTFGQVIAQSPYIHYNTMKQLEVFKTPEQLRLYHVIGDKETKVETSKGESKDFLTPNRKFHKLSQEKGIDVFYDEYIGEHSWPFWQKDLKRALTLMLS